MNTMAAQRLDGKVLAATIRDEVAARVAASAGPPGRILICGSLYLAGEVLKADGSVPA